MKTAIVIPMYKKYDMLKQVIFNLSKNKRFDLIVNFDHNEDITEIRNFILEYFPTAIINQRQKNLKLDLNITFSIHEAFTKYNYDRIFYFEDDVICDATCLETLENLMNWTDKHMPNVGIVQSWNYNLTELPYKEEYYKLHGLEDLNYADACTYAENEIGFTGQNFWGALISKKCWETCCPYILNHYGSYLNGRGFNFQNVQALITKLLSSDVSLKVKERCISRFNIIGWEPILDLAMLANNLVKVTLTNPRSYTIGAEGSTSTNNMFSTVGLDKIKLQEFKTCPTEFVLNEKSKSLWFGK
jgi:hypothetical protein